MNLQLVYRHILSLSKNENMIKKKQQNNKTTKKEGKKLSPAGVKPRTLGMWGQHGIYCATEANVKYCI